jgi:hypothetical protein
MPAGHARAKENPVDQPSLETLVRLSAFAALARYDDQRDGYVPLRTSWGMQVIADSPSAIGRSILTTGVYNIAVSETLFRLISPGDTVFDAGAKNL